MNWTIPLEILTGYMFPSIIERKCESLISCSAFPGDHSEISLLPLSPLPPPPPPPSLRVKHVNYGYASSSSYTQRYHNLFGFPTIVRVPRTTSTYATLYQAILDRCRSTSDQDVLKEDTSIYQQDAFSS